jgi:hypothetical protein
MSKFNKTNKTTITNIVGGKSYTQEFEKDLTSIVLNSMLNKDDYYMTEKDRLEMLISNLDNKGYEKAAEFLSKLIVYTRTKANLRSITHFLIVLMAENVKGSENTKKSIIKSLIRPDDATEIVSLWNERNPNKMLPNSIRKSIKYSLENRWDAYQLKKYYGANNTVKVPDLIKMTHPKPSDTDKEKMFHDAMNGTLENINTVQTVNASLIGKERIKMYYSMLKEKKLGYMGLLKNLSNLFELYHTLSDKKQGKIRKMITDLLTNERALKGSKILPFRLWDAYKSLKYNSITMDRFEKLEILDAIEEAFKLSASNLSFVEPGEKVALLLDESASMGGSNDKSPFTLGKIMLASMMTGLDKSKVVGYTWANSAREINIRNSPFDFIENTMSKGGGTDVSAPLMKLISTKTSVDKIVIFTDMQMYDINRYSNKGLSVYLEKYKKEVNKNVKLLFWDLKGYGSGTPIKLSNDILEVAGYSASMLEVIPKIWKNKNALIEEINSIEL